MIAFASTFELKEELLKSIAEDVFIASTFSYSKRYDSTGVFGGVKADMFKFLKFQFTKNE